MSTIEWVELDPTDGDLKVVRSGPKFRVEIVTHLPGKQRTTPIGNKSVPKIIINDTIGPIYFLNCNQNFGNFKP